MTAIPLRRNTVYKSLHKPLTYLGIERKLFFCVGVTALASFNLFDSFLAGAVVFLAGAAFGYWATNEDPAFLRILARADRFRQRYDAGKQQVPTLEIR